MWVPKQPLYYIMTGSVLLGQKSWLTAAMFDRQQSGITGNLGKIAEQSWISGGEDYPDSCKSHQINAATASRYSQPPLDDPDRARHTILISLKTIDIINSDWIGPNFSREVLQAP